MKKILDRRVYQMTNILLGTALILGTVSGFASNAKANDSYCREYTKNIIVDDQKQTAYGTACLQPDGSWKIISEDELADTKSYSAVNYATVRERVYQPVVIYTQNQRYKKRSKQYARDYRHHNTSNHWRY